MNETDTPQPAGPDAPVSWALWVLLLISLILAVALRLAYMRDIEFKFDEWWMWRAAHSSNLVLTMSGVGMQSGVGIHNPALSVGIFVALCRLITPASPVELARGIALMSVGALLLLGAFASRIREEEDRRTWIWGTALACVNPLAVLLQRKIWAQSVLPLFCVIFLIAWWHRTRPLGALVWGFVGVVLGQIHMSGFIFAFSIASGTALSGRAGTRWGFWLLGSLCGGFLLLPWLYFLWISGLPGNGARLGGFLERLSNQPIADTVFWQYWVSDALGTGLAYSLGSEHFAAFLGTPRIPGGGPTYIVAALHVLLWLCFLLPAARALGKAASAGEPCPPRASGTPMDLPLILQAAFLGFGVLFTAGGFKLMRHYLLVTFPLEWFWLARLILRNSRRPTTALCFIWMAQILLSISFLQYVHVHGGATGGDYGVAFSKRFP